MARHLQGVSITALARGNRRMLAPLKTRHRDAKTQHDELLAALQERRAKAREIKDPAARAKALDELRGERPTHPTLVAIGCTVVAAVVGWPMLHGHHTTALTVGLTAWVITALILGQQEPAAETTEKLAPEGSASTPEPTTPTLAEVHHLTASLASTGSSVLLTRLASELATRHPGWEPSTKAVRALLATVGIRVRDGVRTPDGNGPGVHHKDAPPIVAVRESPPVGVVVADQSANTNANNAQPPAPQEGFTTQPDPDNPARTIVVHAA